MQRKTKTFEEGFSKNTLYRFLNIVKTNWQRFTVLLSSRIINDFMKPLTDEKRKDVFIIDDSLFDRSHSKKAELLAKVFDHCSMKFKKGFRLLTLERCGQKKAGTTDTGRWSYPEFLFPCRHYMKRSFRIWNSLINFAANSKTSFSLF